MRLLLCVALSIVAQPCGAWETTPHQKITSVALATLPKSVLDRFGAEAPALVEIYCTLPDRYVEMESFGFVRKGPGPRIAAEIRLYCVRPDGEPVHGPTGERDADLTSSPWSNCSRWRLQARPAASISIPSSSGRCLSSLSARASRARPAITYSARRKPSWSSAMPAPDRTEKTCRRWSRPPAPATSALW